MHSKLLSTMTARTAIVAGMFSALAIAAIAHPQATSAESVSGTRSDRDNPKAVERAQIGASALANAKALLAAKDSAAALKVLQHATEKDAENGPLWFALAEMLAEKSRSGWSKNFKSNDEVFTVTHAHEAFEKAMQLTPDSIRYGVAYSSFMWSSRSEVATQSGKLRYELKDRLAGSADSTSVAVIANQIGMMMWHAYAPSIGNVRSPSRAEDWLAMRNSAGLMSVGMLDYAKRNFSEPVNRDFYYNARRYFSIASNTKPDSQQFFRHEAMLLVAANRWAETKDLSEKRIQIRPNQPWPWLTLGLSEHWLKNEERAQAAFDSGFARLPAADRDRYSSISKLLFDKKVHWYDTLSKDAKAQLHEVYWNTANPSMLLKYNPRLVEFRARVVYAELRFTEETKPINGAQSDQGEIYIRYGPPDYQIGSLHWLYARELIHFDFRIPWSAYYAVFQWHSHTDLEHYRFESPSVWTNTPILRNRIDSVSALVARFRAKPDSMDVAIFAGVRTGALRRGAEVDTSHIQHGVFFVDALGRELSHQSGTLKSGETDSITMTPQNYFLRASIGTQSVRIEALEPDLMQAARTISDISKFKSSGFGTSDLLIAADIEPPLNKANARWSDYKVNALTGGLVLRGAPLSLLWESYEPGDINGSSHLRYSVSVQRETANGLVALAARVVGGVREALGASSNTTRQLSVSYDREFAATPIAVDHLKLDLGALDPGNYRVTLVVTDLVRKATATSTQKFSILR